jgi:uncharacterized protein (UPF0332 family)
MQYQVKQNKAGKWEAIISNPSFNYSKIFTYETKGGAELRIEIEKEEARQALADVESIWDYLKPIQS